MASAALQIAEDGDATYQALARAIAYLSENYLAQPSLDEAAHVASLSSSHFQRLFQRHVGVSPKNFVAHLTLERAKQSLTQGAGVLPAAWDAGLSGSSRLHDLCLKIETMTPGQYAKGGAGLRIAYGFAPSLFGLAIVTATPRGLCGLGFGDDEEAMLDDMRARWPKAEFIRDDKTSASYAARIFSGKGEMPVQLYGTPWQIKVWQALLTIPSGEVVSYAHVAERVCTRRATRAAASAIGRNPISLLIPCHRVLAGNGAITGYHWGLPRKRAMLAYEAARRPNVSD